VPVVEQTVSFEDWADTNLAALQRFAAAVTGDPHSAADAVQQALVQVCWRWDRIQGNQNLYVRRCIVNAHRSAWRKWRRERTAPDVGVAEPVADGTSRVDDADMAARLVRQLPARQRAAVTLRYLEEREYAEIAEVMNTTEANARSLVRHALKSLRKLAEGGANG
jgi:RNA polymerase sigma factor (sigma-70 family)